MASTTHSATRLEIRRLVHATRERVFEAWTRPEALRQWFAPSDDYEVPEAAVDLRVGGTYRVVMRTPEGEHHAVTGTFREVRPPERLVFSWAWQGDSEMGESVVTVELRERGVETELFLAHELFPTPEARDKHEQGWNGCLDRLTRHVRLHAA